MALDVLGRLGFFNCGSGSVVTPCSASARLSSELEPSKQRNRSWFRSPGSGGSTWAVANILCFDKDTIPESFRNGRLRSRARQKTLLEGASRSSLSSAARLWISKTAGIPSSRTGCRGSVLNGGWSGGEVAGEGRKSLLPIKRHSSCSSQSLPQQQRRTKDAGRVVCYSHRKRNLGSLLGSRVVEEPWSWILEGYVLKGLTGRRNDGPSELELGRGSYRGGPVHGANHIRPLQRPDSVHPQPLTSARQVFLPYIERRYIRTSIYYLASNPTSPQIHSLVRTS